MKRLKNLFFITSITMAMLLSVKVFASESTSKKEEALAASETAQQETAEALAAIKDFTIESRDEMLEEATQWLAYIDQRIDRLSSKIETQSASATDSVKAQWQEALKTLREQRIAVAQWLGGVQYSSQEAWEEVKEGFSQAYQDLSGTLQTEETKMEKVHSAASKAK